MTCRFTLRSILACSLALPAVCPASADSSHARVIRLSLVQGDVRFTRQAHGDPLADSAAVWETAQANLPIRRGYVVATDNGRAEVEFENGAMAFLSENAVLDFYDLSLNDGARTTRLVLRQGSASFYVNPAGDDYFSVTGGDFTVEATAKVSFRMNNFDDGSNVNILSGHLVVLHNDEKTQLAKGQSLSMKAGENAVAVERLPEDDDFDHWVSGRIDSVSNATTASMQYTPAGSYLPGFADLSSYGNWFSCGGYGYGWQPFGVGVGWSPFSAGQWFWDPGFGWTFGSFAPWGWAPYHYGGWLFDASCGGWFYSPPIFYNYGPGGFPGRRIPPRVNPPHPLYRASTAVFVRQNGQLGIVPMHPLDKAGKPPLNLSHGVLSTEGSGKLAESVQAGSASDKWQTVKSPSHAAMSSGLVATAPPERVSRTLVQSAGGSRVISLGHGSSIAYDPREHRYVNTNSAASNEKKESADVAPKTSAIVSEKASLEVDKNNSANRDAAKASVARASAAPPRSIPNPPPSPHSSSSSGGSRGGAEVTGGGSSHASAPPSPPPAPHVSAPSGGGRPH